MTGLAGTLANDLVYLAGGAPLVLLVMGAITSFIFGLGMTVTACYIFLAIVLAPPLVKAGLDPLAVHMFIHLLGHGVVHHAAGRARGLRRRADRRRLSQMRIGMQGDAARHRDLLRPVLLRAQSGACCCKGDPADGRASAIVCAFAGIVARGRRVAGLRASGSAASPITPAGLARARLSLIAGGVLSRHSGRRA